MSTSTMVLAVLVGLGTILFGGCFFASSRGASGTGGDSSSDPVGDEHQAAAASEAIEELVNLKLSKIPELAGTRIDFGSAADGSLEIWIGDQRYTAVDEIPDPRVQQAVREAVTSFNK